MSDLNEGSVFFPQKKEASHFRDRLRLAQKAEIEADEEWMDWLDEISTFNLNARYDNYKHDFYKLATKEFTEIWIGRIEKIREWLIQKL